MAKRRKFVGTGPFRWKQASALPHRMYVRRVANIQADAIATIEDVEMRSRACAEMYARLAEFDPKLDRRWFERKCNVESEG